MHVTPLRSSRALALRFLANKFGLDMSNFTVSDSLLSECMSLHPCMRSRACSISSKPAFCNCTLNHFPRYSSDAFHLPSHPSSDLFLHMQMLTVPANVLEKGEVSVVSTHTSDMIELVSGVCKVCPPSPPAASGYRPEAFPTLLKEACFLDLCVSLKPQWTPLYHFLATIPAFALSSR